jgi:hypothetical protein
MPWKIYNDDYSTGVYEHLWVAIAVFIEFGPVEQWREMKLGVYEVSADYEYHFCEYPFSDYCFRHVTIHQKMLDVVAHRKERVCWQKDGF